MPTSGPSVSSPPTEPSAESARQTAGYVAALTLDLSRMAARERLWTLSYLLDMARLEAESAASGKPEVGRKPPKGADGKQGDSGPSADGGGVL